MREIKFDIISKHPDSDELHHDVMTLEDIEQAGADEWDYEVVARRQYIGDDDASGRPIFEEDILGDPQDPEFRTVVRWSAKYHCFGADGIDDEDLSKHSVLGNTYDNPDMAG
jgi:hypothetical protein